MSTFLLFKFKHRVLVPGVVYVWLLMSTYRDLDIELCAFVENITPCKVWTLRPFIL